LERAKGINFEDEGKAAVHKSLNFVAMAQEMIKLQERCDKVQSPVVFCHNDLLSGNIMVMGASKNDSIEEMATKPLQLIDFEYSGYSYRGFDWGACLWVY
jgi:ethanolamine kinase